MIYLNRNVQIIVVLVLFFLLGAWIVFGGLSNGRLIQVQDMNMSNVKVVADNAGLDVKREVVEDDEGIVDEVAFEVVADEVGDDLVEAQVDVRDVEGEVGELNEVKLSDLTLTLSGNSIPSGGRLIMDKSSKTYSDNKYGIAFHYFDGVNVSKRDYDNDTRRVISLNDPLIGDGAEVEIVLDKLKGYDEVLNNEMNIRGDYCEITSQSASLAGRDARLIIMKSGDEGCGVSGDCIKSCRDRQERIVLLENGGVVIGVSMINEAGMGSFSKIMASLKLLR